MVFSKIVMFSFIICACSSTDEPSTCRDRSSFFRQDGGLCFEIPPWQHQPVELASHMSKVRTQLGTSTNLTEGRIQTQYRPGLSNGEISRYMDTVIAPFLDTYHRNIQNSYQQLTSKILRRIKEEVNAAVKRKQQIYKDLLALAEEIEVPPLCDEERRQARTIASNHVAQIFECTEEARASIAKMGKYAEEMISLTRNHMQRIIGNEVQTFNSTEKNISSNIKKSAIDTCLVNISKAAVSLGYELDLSLTNARRHNEQSCERLSACISKARKRTEESVKDLQDLLYQCVYT